VVIRSDLDRIGGPFVGEIEFEEALVRALLHEQHPDLAGLELQKAVGGWDTSSSEGEPKWERSS
jgi:hypothetical protein